MDEKFNLLDNFFLKLFFHIILSYKLLLQKNSNREVT